MKFSKKFASQMVPEWHEKYLDYINLKTLIKEIHTFKQSRNPNSSATLSKNQSGNWKRKFSLYRAFSGSTQTNHHHPPSPNPDIENHAITVNCVSSEREGATEESYETTFMMAAEDGAEYELVFFRQLDDEFNKVDKFYREKVEEVMKEAKMLNRQMDALVAFRVKLENPKEWEWENRTVEMTRLASDIAASADALDASTPAEAKPKEEDHIEVIREEGSSNAGQQESSGEDDKDNEEETDEVPNKGRATSPSPVEILDCVKINSTPGTPGSTIKGVLRVQSQTEPKFNRENLKKVEQVLKRAFVEFYHKLRILKSYSFLNTLAISKIMKKYDKVSSRNASKPYMKMVDNSFLGSSEQVTKLLERVEETFIKHFANANRSKGMSILRPQAKKQKHSLTFSIGFFGGCTFSLIITLVLFVRAQNILDHPGTIQYMETMFPLYSLFGFIVLHMLVYAIDIYYWRRYQVNYAFIFGFKPGTELGYREILLLSFSLATVALLCVLANLDMEVDPVTQDYKALTELLPLFLVLVLFAITIMPFNFLYRSSRMFFLTCLFHCIAAPFYKVTLPDFLLADQLTSQFEAMRSLEFYVCHYGWGEFKLRRNTCSSSEVYNTFLFIVTGIPYLTRLLQCLRRLFEENNTEQGYNALKYWLTILAICLRTAYSLQKNIVWQVLAWIFSVIAAVFSTYWDLIYDWGLLNRNSKNRWLRDKLLVPYPNVYFIAMGLNILLRFAWLQIVLDFQVSFMHKNTMIAIVASLEIIRRGIWNFFRLENEHLNNVGQYRAFKSVPLPFTYDDDEEKDD